MSEQDKKEDIDPAAIKVIDHVLIKDKDTGEVFVNKRDSKQVKR